MTTYSLQIPHIVHTGFRSIVTLYGKCNFCLYTVQPIILRIIIKPRGMFSENMVCKHWHFRIHFKVFFVWFYLHKKKRLYIWIHHLIKVTSLNIQKYVQFTSLLLKYHCITSMVTNLLKLLSKPILDSIL